MKTGSPESTEATKLEMELSQRGFFYCDIIPAVNALLPLDLWLTDASLGLIISVQQEVDPDQACALATILQCSVADIFPHLETGRKTPIPEQAATLDAVLSVPVEEIFPAFAKASAGKPDLEKEVSKPWKPACEFLKVSEVPPCPKH